MGPSKVASVFGENASQPPSPVRHLCRVRHTRGTHMCDMCVSYPLILAGIGGYLLARFLQCIWVARGLFRVLPPEKEP